MNNNRPFAPKFINNLDRFLLLNKPSAWSARTHLVLYYGFLFFIVLTTLAFLVPDDPRKDSQSGAWVGFVSVISFIGLVLYTIYLLRFNVFKRFGDKGRLNRLITFLLTYIAIGTFVFFPFVEPYVETVRANNQYTDEEINRDVNEINLSINKLEYDSLSHTWARDTIRVIPDMQNGASRDHEYNERELVPDIDVTTTVTTGAPYTSFRIVQVKDLDLELRKADSFTRIADSMFVILSCPVYKHLSPYFKSSFPDDDQYASVDIYHRLIKDFKGADRSAEQKKLSALKEKYAIRTYNYFEPYSHELRMKNRYAIHEIGNSMENITERMHRFDAEQMPVFIRIHFYVTLCLTLLLFTFRHSTAKSFFFGLLTGTVITILTSLFLAFSTGRDSNWFTWILVYYLLFFVVTLYVFQSNVRNLFTGIAMNLFVWLTPFIPLTVVAAYYERLSNSNRDFNYDQMQHDLATAEWIGLAFFLVLLVSYIHSVYRKWYAAAEE